MSVTRIGVSLPTEMIETIDKDRGDIPRSRYLFRLVEKQLKESKS